MAMSNTNTVAGLEDLEFVKGKLFHYPDRFMNTGQKLGFFYVLAPGVNLMDHAVILGTVMSHGFKRRAITPAGGFIGIHVPYADVDYKSTGMNVARYFSDKNIKVGTASLIALEGNYDVAQKRLDDLVSFSLKEGEHKELR